MAVIDLDLIGCRRRSWLSSLGKTCLSSALPAWIEVANDRCIRYLQLVASLIRARVFTFKDRPPNLRFMAIRIKGTCQVRFKYVGSLSEKWNLEEKSRLLKCLEIYSRWNRSRYGAFKDSYLNFIFYNGIALVTCGIYLNINKSSRHKRLV